MFGKAFQPIKSSACWLPIMAVVLFLACTKDQDPSEARVDSPNAGTLRLLAWTGYEEEDFLRDFEQEFDATVQVKTYAGGDQMFALYNSAPPGTYDLLVVDAEYGQKLREAGRLSPLPENRFDLSGYMPPFSDFPPSYADGEMYTLVIRWGSIGFVYNTEKVSLEEATTYTTLWSEKVSNRIGIWDWYLPNMGVMSIANSFNPPYRLSTANFEALADSLMRLRPSVRAIHSQPSDIISGFANGEIWLAPGIGEWIAAPLMREGLPIDWSVPQEGGLMWVEALALPSDSKNPDLALSFMEWATRPSVQTSLAWRQAYCSFVPTWESFEQMTDQQRDILHVSSRAEMLTLLERIAIRELPVEQTEADWQQIWSQFKARD